ncbi:MAG: hypothetical protein DBX47_07340 [Clostridiales bacterium]|nr:MAG: hypothetical protein DBX47_07340 [Clostridiales bacterium]
MKEWLRRALRTFLQTAIGYITTNLAVAAVDWNDFNVVKSVLIGFVISGIAAGIAAVMNLHGSESKVD